MECAYDSFFKRKKLVLLLPSTWDIFLSIKTSCKSEKRVKKEKTSFVNIFIDILKNKSSWIKIRIFMLKRLWKSYSSKIKQIKEILTICALAIWCLLVWTNQKSNVDREGYHLLETGFRKFSFSELKKVTKGFSEEIRRGGGWFVYKSILSYQKGRKMGFEGKCLVE